MKKVKKETCISILKDAFEFYPSFVNRNEAIDVTSLSSSDFNDLAKYIDETIGVTAGGKSIKALLDGAGPKNSTINILCAFLLVKKDLMSLSELKLETNVSDNRYYVRRYFETNSVEENSKQTAKAEVNAIDDKNSGITKDPVVTPKYSKPYLYGFIGIAVILLAVFGVSQVLEESPAFPELRITIADNSDKYPKEISVAYDLKSSEYLKNTRISFMSTPILLNKLKGTVTVIAPHPGFYPIKLYSNKNVYDMQRVLLVSDGWQGYINTGTPLLSESCITKEVMHLNTVSDLQKLVDGDYYTSFNIFRNFNISGDSFEMEADIKNPPNEGSPWAHDISVDVVGFENPITFNFLSPDALKHANMIVGDTDFKIGEKQKTLQHLGVLFPDWKHLTVTCKNNRIRILLDDKQIINEHYDGEIGQVVGLQFFFKGSGYVKNVKLNGKLI